MVDAETDFEIQLDVAAELLVKAVQRVLSTAAECHRSREALDLVLQMALDNLHIAHDDYQRCFDTYRKHIDQ